MNVMRISGRKFLWIVGIFFAPVNFRTSAQVLYNFTRITNPDLIQARGAPSLNESGRVAFKGFDAGFHQGIFSGDGSEMEFSDYTTIALAPAVTVNFFGSYVGSRVIFSGIVSGKQGVYNSDGVNVETIVIDPTIKDFLNIRPLMNSTRQYAYEGGDFNSEKGGLYIAQNGTSNAVYTIPTFNNRSGLQLAGVFEFDTVPVQITDSGDVFFDGVFSCRPHNPPQPNDCTDEVEGIIKGSAGNPPTLLVPEGTVNAAGDFVSIDALSASHSGLLAYVASTSDDMGIYYRLVKANNPVTDTRSGPFESFNYVAINNGGSIVFFAEFRDAAGKHNEGLFNGPDLVRNKIIALGDPLFDSTVASFDWHPVGFNDAGQIAFLVNLASGKTLAVRADPVDGSTQVEWIGPGSGATPVSGSATVPTNWKPLNGDPPREPTKNSTFNDTALFDRPEEYSVDLGLGRHADRLLVKNGQVTFENGDITVDALSFELPSMEVENARLTLSSPLLPISPTITCNYALIGGGLGPARVDVVHNGQWLAHGSLRIGGPGEGILTIDSDAKVTSAESRLGGTGGGHANIGEGGRWETGSLAIGIDHGRGDMTIQDGGVVVSDIAVIGHEPGLGNNVVVRGARQSDPSLWQPFLLKVGENGNGQLRAEDGGTANVQGVLTIGSELGGNGVVSVTGVGASGVPSEVSAAEIAVGEFGVAELNIDDGGLAEAATIRVSRFPTGRGTVHVRGLNGDTILPSKLVADDLGIGDLSPALMSIEGRAEVVSHNANIFSPDVAHASKVSVVGGLASWRVEAREGENDDGILHVGSDFDEVTQGRAIINLVHSFLSADHVIVGPTGWIVGAGIVSNRGETINHGLIGALLTNFFNIVASPAGPRSEGFIKAAAVNNGAQGLSSGTLTIQGKYIQGPQGRLLIEIGGANPEAHSHLVITKEATLDGTLELRFINGFAPKRGDTFNFLHVGGSLSGAFAAVEMKNLAADFQFNVSTNGTNISLAALNDATFVKPLQGQISSSNAITVGGISYLPYQLRITNDCSIVEVSGDLRRAGQELFQELTERSDSACEERSANVSRILPLGALPPGNYQFHFMLDGVAVYDASFSVPADTGELLKVSRASSDELKLEISGLPGVLYTSEASADLKTWSNLPTHVGTLLGPYSVLEPFSSAKARFYRVKIE
jgi:hypothetical protein